MLMDATEVAGDSAVWESFDDDGEIIEDCVEILKLDSCVRGAGGGGIDGGGVGGGSFPFKLFILAKERLRSGVALGVDVSGMTEWRAI